MKPGFGDLLNIVKGALLMQFNLSNVPRSAVAFGLFGILMAVSVSIETPRRYESIAMIGIQAERPDESRATWAVIAPHVFSDESLTRLIEQNGLYTSKFRSRPMADRLDRFKHNILVLPWTPQVWKLSFTYPDSQKAHKVTADLVQRLVIEENLHAAHRVAPGEGIRHHIMMYYGVSPFQTPVGANLIEMITVWVSGGALAGVLVVMLRRRVQPSA
jgi:hypothetical protein